MLSREGRSIAIVCRPGSSVPVELRRWVPAAGGDLDRRWRGPAAVGVKLMALDAIRAAVAGVR
jgi:hypothetical protein